MTDAGMHIGVARVYEPRSESDGRRVLVDRLWPRGLARADAELDEWCRDVAPSTELRKWYSHRADRFEQFRDRYLAELDDADHAEAVSTLQAVCAGSRVTLLTATRELAGSHARILADSIRARVRSGR